MALSLERLLTGCDSSELSRGGPRGTNTAAGVVLGRPGARILFAFDHAGVLFNALLSGASAAARVGHGSIVPSKRHDRNARGSGNRNTGICGNCFHLV